jgi:hypothetical protein
MVWMERCRVLSDQLALAAPEASHTQQDANLTDVGQIATTDASVPFLARLRAQAPWVVAVLAIVAVTLLLVVR